MRLCLTLICSQLSKQSVGFSGDFWRVGGRFFPSLGKGSSSGGKEVMRWGEGGWEKVSRDS